MDFIRSNLYNTTTSIVVNSNTDTAEHLINTDRTLQYISNGFNNDATTTTIRINFDSTQLVSRIAMVNHNLKSFTVFYNGATANTFSLDNQATTVSDFSTNSSTSTYLKTANLVACTSVSFDLKSTIVANNEKAIGYLVISNTYFTLSRPPPAKGYKPKLDPMDVVHKLSDGGTRIQFIAEKYNVMLSYKNLTLTDRDNLKTLWDQKTEFIFCPFGTSTAWDAVIFPCVWSGTFDFFEFSDDSPDTGFSGKINLMETPS